jgi:hypothetical protein
MASESFRLSGEVLPKTETAAGEARPFVATPEVPAAARHWTAVAVGSLVVAGLLSLSVVIGRLPVISPLIADPLFFKRCLVVHVDLSLLVWFYGFLVAMAALRTPRGGERIGRAGLVMSVAGVLAMLAGALVPGAEPILANYVPVIDHPVFLLGLGLFFAGVLTILLRNLLAPPGSVAGGLPADAARGVQAAAVAMMLAAATAVTALAGLPAGLDAPIFYEFAAWGSGHVLQVANVCAMLAAWLWLLRRATGVRVMTATAARRWFILLLVPHFAMPLLTWRGSLNTLYIDGATQLMTWGIFPVVLAVLSLCVRHLKRHPLKTGDVVARAARAGFAASAALTLLGFALGAMIRESTTLIPAHYHASLGAVTVSFMAGAYLMFESLAAGRGRLEAARNRLRKARHQLAGFACGQAVFAAGFGIAGWHGLGRKSYGAEQHVRTTGEFFGLGVMGFGGLVAVAAGLWFIFLALREIRRWREPAAPPERSIHPIRPTHEPQT